MSLRVKLVPLDPLAEATRTEALGAIARYRDGQVLRRASWDEARIATGSGNRPSAAKCLRTADGRWRVCCDGAYTLVEVSGDRITGTCTHLDGTRVDGGIRLEDRWLGAGVRLLPAGRPRATVPRGTSVPSPSGCSTWNIRRNPVRSPEHSRSGSG